MKVCGFDNRTYTWPPSGYVPLENETKPRSNLHIRTRKILRDLYPTQRILEEVPLPSTGLFADFVVSQLNIVVEVHGEQHYNFIPHFHGTKMNFIHARQNDSKKREWCELNNIRYIELPYNESDEQWRQRIINSRTETGTTREDTG